MIKITQAPTGPVLVRQAFVIAGTTSPSYAGTPIALTVDNQYRTTGPAVELDGSWRVSFSFQQPGSRLLAISIEGESIGLKVQVVATAPTPPAAARLRFTNPPTSIQAEEAFVLNGEADRYNDGDQLVLRADRTIELARPRVTAGKWQATLLFRQPGSRLIEIIGSEQDRAQITLNVLGADLQIIPRSAWINQPTSAALPNLQPQRITFHHTAVSPTLSPNASQADETERMRQIWRIHIQTNGWSDIGYHFIIMPSGRIYEARAEQKRGAHDVINDGLGIAFDGVYTSATITQTQFQAAVNLSTKLCQRYGISDPVTPVPTVTADFGTRNLPRIIGHRDRVSTECPGSAGGKTVRLEEIRQAVKKAL